MPPLPLEEARPREARKAMVALRSSGLARKSPVCRMVRPVLMTSSTHINHQEGCHQYQSQIGRKGVSEGDCRHGVCEWLGG